MMRKPHNVVSIGLFDAELHRRHFGMEIYLIEQWAEDLEDVPFDPVRGASAVPQKDNEHMEVMLERSGDPNNHEMQVRLA